MEILPDQTSPPLWLFAGEAVSKLDQKFRLTVPADWRANGALKEIFLLTNVARGCITALPKEVLQQIDKEIRGRDISPEMQRNYITDLYSSATRCPVDTQGRLTLTEEMRRALKIQGEVAMSGSSDRFEIRSLAASKEQKQQDDARRSDMLRSIGL